ncbi:hypothetical protein BC828DRAFT_405077 [Blastocladiella britannica]|nr:hypothetical protein BC828DRAFT_405077 [Blastocladiella britannica]
MILPPTQSLPRYLRKDLRQTGRFSLSPSISAVMAKTLDSRQVATLDWLCDRAVIVRPVVSNVVDSASRIGVPVLDRINVAILPPTEFPHTALVVVGTRPDTCPNHLAMCRWRRDCAVLDDLALQIVVMDMGDPFDSTWNA